MVDTPRPDDAVGDSVTEQFLKCLPAATCLMLYGGEIAFGDGEAGGGGVAEPRKGGCFQVVFDLTVGMHLVQRK